MLFCSGTVILIPRPSPPSHPAASSSTMAPPCCDLPLAFNAVAILPSTPPPSARENTSLAHLSKASPTASSSVVPRRV